MEVEKKNSLFLLGEEYSRWEGVIYKFTEEDIQKCQKFMEEMRKLTKDIYKTQKSSTDNRNGKLGEVAVYKRLSQEGCQVSEPNFKAYENREKAGWEADLIVDGHHTAVKSSGHLPPVTEDLLKRYSIVFQNGDGRFDPVLTDDRRKKEWLICTYIVYKNDGRLTPDYAILVSWSIIGYATTRLQPMKKKSLRDSKMAFFPIFPHIAPYVVGD